MQIVLVFVCPVSETSFWEVILPDKQSDANEMFVVRVGCTLQGQIPLHICEKMLLGEWINVVFCYDNTQFGMFPWLNWRLFCSWVSYSFWNKTSKTKILIKWGICGLISVSLRILDVKKFGNRCRLGSTNGDQIWFQMISETYFSVLLQSFVNRKWLLYCFLYYVNRGNWSTTNHDPVYCLFLASDIFRNIFLCTVLL